ncbi:MAG: serine/threonine protein kinase, partial [Chloroflexaceae bacterium]|nr:serine/threonine protein kinase [Chloroflexaceae bacterium]
MSVLLQPGTIIHSRYCIVRLLGQGGMGAVYEAENQAAFGSKVALKQIIIPPTATPQQVDLFVRAFEREARMLSDLDHPALPDVRDYFTTPEGRFLAMKFVSGRDLNEMLKQRLHHTGHPFAENEVLDWLDQVLEALEYLHARTPPVVHRDLKPHNLKLTPRGQVMVLDFGIAKGVSAQTSGASSSMFAYTLDYAPLEQIQGKGTDPRSDLFSLASTACHLILGRSLKELHADALSRVSAVADGQPDPLPPLPGVSQTMQGALRQALALKPDHRPAQCLPEMRR